MGVSEARVGVLSPLKHRDFRLLAGGSLVSLLGDGVFRVTIAIQVLAIRNDALALSLVASCWAVSQFVVLPAGGWAADRFQRRTVMVVADVVRASALGVLAALSLSGGIALWHLCVLGAVVGAANGFFNPTATSLVPDLLPREDLERANAFLGVARPLMLWIVGPFVGASVVAAGGPGAALGIDALTFLVSGALLTGIARRPVGAPGDGSGTGGWRRTRDDLSEGLRYVRSRPWAWAWILATALGTLVYSGGFDVLLPTLLINDLGFDETQTARTLAYAFAAGGAGSVVASTYLGQRGLPGRFLTTLFLAQGVSMAAVAGFSLVRASWQVAAFGLVIFTSSALIEVTSATMFQRLVPRRLLGRVASLDWMASVGLAPVGFVLAGQLGALTTPRVAIAGMATTGLVGVIWLALIPGVRSSEQLGALRDRSSDDPTAADGHAPVVRGPLSGLVTPPINPPAPPPASPGQQTDPSWGPPQR